jgi:hypothetical protein
VIYFLYITRSFIIVHVAKYYYADQEKENEIGGSYSTHGDEKDWIKGFGRNTDTL